MRWLHRLALKLERHPSHRTIGAISVFTGYGTSKQVRVLGRLFERVPGLPAEDDSKRRNLLRTIRRFLSKEVPDQPFSARVGTAAIDAESDNEGYVDVTLEGSFEPGTHEAVIGSGGVLASGCVIVPGHADFGVISDLDDTVLQTGATRPLKMLARTIFRNAYTRLPFEGVDRFYRVLHADQNPFYYVSSSPWNLYPLLHGFLKVNDIPDGPLMLMDYGIAEDMFIHRDHPDHKLEQIEALLSTFAFPFVLIGDSGQKDPQIYAQVIEEHPDRVSAVFIRRIGKKPLDARLVRAATEHDVPLVFSDDSAEMEEHARRIGLIEDRPTNSVVGQSP